MNEEDKKLDPTICKLLQKIKNKQIIEQEEKLNQIKNTSLTKIMKDSGYWNMSQLNELFDLKE